MKCRDPTARIWTDDVITHPVTMCSGEDADALTLQPLPF